MNASTVSTQANTKPRAILVQPTFGRAVDERSHEEFQRLALAAGCEIVGEICTRRDQPEARFLIGSGKVDELTEQVQQSGASLILLNHRLSPIQERNLARATGAAVLDRTTLILDIFAQRARSHEGKLQVELAQLRHLSTRLVRGWTHLERQRGGIGMRGPGETQLETDRRLLADRIRLLRGRLDRVERHRARGRRARDRNYNRNSPPLVALVGYTNAGKSTLFNRITDAQVVARDQLFATLDPTVRKIEGINGSSVLASDTVGFIENLPHELIAAFRATLEETLSASLVLHVIDAADPARDIHQQTVEQVLDDIGAGDLPRLKVFNKIDCTEYAPTMVRDDDGQPSQVWLSARTGAGVAELLEAIGERVSEGRICGWIELPARLQKLRSQLFDLGAIVDEEVAEDGSSRLQIDLARRDAHDLSRLGGRDGYWVNQHLLKC